MARLLALSAAALVSPSIAEMHRGFVATGRQTSFIVDENGTARASGRNDYGQLGVDSNASSSTLDYVRLPTNTLVSEIAAGGFHTLFLTTEGKVYGTGRNNHGQLGMDAGTSSVRSPVLIADEVKAVAAGYAHSLFLFNNGSVKATGYNNHGQLAINSTEHAFSLQPIGGPTVNYTGIAAGYDFSFFISEAGVHAAGQNLGGQLGDGSKESRLLPVSVSKQSVQAIAAGYSHALFLLSDKTVHGTGANFDGQSGPVDFDVKMVYAGGDSSCVVKQDATSTLYGFGSNRAGQLGLGEKATIDVPEEIPPSDVDHYDASISDSHMVFVTYRNKVYGTGSNSYGELAGHYEDSSLNNAKEVFDIELPTTLTTTKKTTTEETTTGEETTTEVVTTTGETTTVSKNIKDTERDFTRYFWAAGVGLVIGVLAFLLPDGRPANDGAQSADVDESGLVQMRAEQMGAEQLA